MNSIGDIITVPDAVNEDTDVPAIVTAVADDGTVSVTVFGSSDVVEKRTGVSTETDDSEVYEESTPIAEPAATGSRRASAATIEGEK